MVKLLQLKCYETSNSGLVSKGVSRVIDCPLGGTVLGSIPEIRDLVADYTKRLLGGLSHRVEYENSESIGYTHTLHRFHIVLDGDMYIGARVVMRGTSSLRILFTIPTGFQQELGVLVEAYAPNSDLEAEHGKAGEPADPPRGQVYINIPIVYAILGVPNVDVSKWILEVTGMVENPAHLSLVDLYELGVVDYKTSFHCVTGWSIREIVFTGIPVTRIIERVRPRSNVKWVYIESLDGYSTIVPYEDFAREESMIVLEMDRRPLDILHGYPARLIIPHLYGWKSAKWISRIELTDKYRDGYWEALGYHPRGKVVLEERFKQK